MNYEIFAILPALTLTIDKSSNPRTKMLGFILKSLFFSRTNLLFP